MTIIIEGLSVNYRDEGRGPVVVLLHGWGQQLATFDALAARLADKYRIIRLDLPGFGGSQRPAEEWGVGDYAKFVKSFLGKLKVGTVEGLVGHSLGGRVAIKLAGDQLLVPSKLILLNSAGIKHSDNARNQAFKTAAKLGKAATILPGLRSLRGKLRKSLYEAAGSTDYLKSGPMRQIFLKVINEDLQSTASKITAPTLLVWGDQDAETPLAEGRRLHELIAGSRFEVLSAGHFVYLDQPERAAQLITEFLA